ncbi:MAG: GNAT family N-acetyltransferase [Pseudomonadota bacterium]
MTLQIRQPAMEDYAAWARLWAAYNVFYGRVGETSLPPEVIETTWRRLLNPGTPVVALVAEQNSCLVGLAHVVFHPNLIQVADTCYLQDLFTEPGARGSGIARALIKGIEDECRQREVADIYWHTHEENAAARQLYNRVATNTGFIVYRIKPLGSQPQ